MLVPGAPVGHALSGALVGTPDADLVEHNHPGLDLHVFPAAGGGKCALFTLGVDHLGMDPVAVHLVVLATYLPVLVGCDLETVGILDVVGHLGDSAHMSVRVHELLEGSTCWQLLMGVQGHHRGRDLGVGTEQVPPRFGVVPPLANVFRSLCSRHNTVTRQVILKMYSLWSS